MTDLTSLDLETTAEERSTLAKLLKHATPAPWEVDTEKNDGCYGIGDDIHEGFQSPVMSTADGKRLFDASNSDTASVEEEWDEDSHSAWDEVGRRNFELIAALRNAADRALRDFDKLVAEILRLRALTTPGEAATAEEVADDIAGMLVSYGERVPPRGPGYRDIRDSIKKMIEEHGFGFATRETARANVATAERDAALARVAELEAGLRDLLSWFSDKPSPAEWRLEAGKYGADDAINQARSLLTKPTAGDQTDG